MAAALQELSSSATLAGESAGILGENTRKGNMMVRGLTDLLLPSTIKNAANPEAHQRHLMEQKRYVSELSAPDALRYYAGLQPEEQSIIARDVRDKVYADARNRPQVFTPQTAALAQKNFNIRLYGPKIGAIGTPQPVF